MSAQQLALRRSCLSRQDIFGEDLDYLDRSDNGIDSKESARDFLQSIDDFTTRKAQEAANLRRKLGVPEGLEKNHGRQSFQKYQSKSKEHPS